MKCSQASKFKKRIVFVYMFKCTSNLVSIFENLLLLKVDLILHCFLDHKLKVVFFCPFYCYKKLV